MKKKKLLRNASLVALSAVMTCGVALGATACSGANDDPGTLRVSIFCNAADAATNQAICDAWAEEYGKQIGKEITVQLEPNTSKDEYFKALGNIWTTPDQVADVIYLAPRYVKAYVEKGRIVDLSDYIAQLDAEAGTTKNVDNLNRLWDNSLNYYGYAKGKQATYTMGQAIKYNKSGANGAGFYTVNGNEKVGLYALPKDYSNFSTGYNRIFFTPELKEAYTKTKANAERNVGGPTGEGTGEFTSKLTYTAATGEGSQLVGNKSCIVYATDVNNFTDKYNNVHNAKAGDPANIINVGIPTTYYPFNFFRFASFHDALMGGDPMANLCYYYTNGKGYTVTIPGFPEETFKVPTGTATDPNAPYDTTIGHITYTYAEYSALLWAMTYYLNTFNWNGSEDGKGGYEIKTGNNKGSYTIYAGEQYEGAAGSPLYLLPWLASNDADLIDITSRYCTQSKLDTTTVSENVADLNVASPEAWRDVAGKNYDTVKKQTLSGTPIERNIQYGYNSENFIETYGAFLALSSDWNGNPMGDTDATRTNNGWSYFRSGRAIFYGAGSWDAATRNDVSWEVLQCGQMPTPIAEKYALYSNIKGANYEMVEYSNDPTDVESATSYGDRQRTNKQEGLNHVYTTDEIIANQVKRQDKWAARMDSVGYAVTNKDRSGDNEWKTRGAASLALALTAQDSSQITLTYGGAQLPNFKDQCVDFFKYQEKEDGVFKDMITPEGFSTTKYYNEDGSVNAAGKTEADAIWAYYYGVAKEMATKSLSGDQQTVGQFLAGKPDYNGSGSIRYDKQYENTKLSEFVGENTNISFAMKVLRMVTYYRSDRDLNIRMQYGLNAVRDSSMYTYDQDWMGKLDARDVSQILAYRRQAVVKPDAPQTIIDVVRTNPAGSATTYYTPAVYCFTISKGAHDELLEAIKNEATAMR